MSKGSKRRPGDAKAFRRNYDRIFWGADSDHPDRRECPMCAYITLEPAEDEYSDGWTCTHCGTEIHFGEPS